MRAEWMVLHELPRRALQRARCAAVTTAVVAVDRESALRQHVVVIGLAGLRERHDHHVPAR